MGEDSFLMLLCVLCARVGRAVASRSSQGQASVAGERRGLLGLGWAEMACAGQRGADTRVTQPPPKARALCGKSCPFLGYEKD